MFLPNTKFFKESKVVSQRECWRDHYFRHKSTRNSKLLVSTYRIQEEKYVKALGLGTSNKLQSEAIPTEIVCKTCRKPVMGFNA